MDVLKFSGGFISEGCHVLIQGAEFVLKWLEVRGYHLFDLAAESVEDVGLEIKMCCSSGAGLSCVLAMFGSIKGICSLRFLGFGRCDSGLSAV